MTRRRLLLAGLLAGVFLLPTACEGDDPSPASSTADTSDTTPASDPGPGTPVTVKAGDLFLDPAEVTVPPGAVTFTYVNDGVQRHTLVIDGVDGFMLEVMARGDTDQGNVALERRGRYSMYCDVPGHREAGMEGMVVVK